MSKLQQEDLNTAAERTSCPSGLWKTTEYYVLSSGDEEDRIMLWLAVILPRKGELAYILSRDSHSSFTGMEEKWTEKRASRQSLYVEPSVCPSESFGDWVVLNNWVFWRTVSFQELKFWMKILLKVYLNSLICFLLPSDLKAVSKKYWVIKL